MTIEDQASDARRQRHQQGVVVDSPACGPVPPRPEQRHQQQGCYRDQCRQPGGTTDQDADPDHEQDGAQHRGPCREEDSGGDPQSLPSTSSVPDVVDISCDRAQAADHRTGIRGKGLTDEGRPCALRHFDEQYGNSQWRTTE